MKLFVILLSLFTNPEKEETVIINKTYEVSSPEDMLVVVNNIHGPVSIEASDDGKVHLNLEIIINAPSDQLIGKAKMELQLGEIERNDSLVFYTKAPFVKMCELGGISGFNVNSPPEYSYKYAYTLKVPEEVAVTAKTVDVGDVTIKNISNTVYASNVNGSIEIENARKVMHASTVNGDVSITFLESPKEPVDFSTVNGDFNFEFPEDLNVKVFFNSMNGEIYTSFDYSRISPQVERSNEHGRYRIEMKTGVEIGAGGPALSFNTINGNAYLKKLN